MSQKSIGFKYIHQIKGRSKEGEKEHDVSAIADFYNEQIGKGKGSERIFADGECR